MFLAGVSAVMAHRSVYQYESRAVLPINVSRAVLYEARALMAFGEGGMDVSYRMQYCGKGHLTLAV